MVRSLTGLRQGTELDEGALTGAANAAAEYVEDIHPELYVDVLDADGVTVLSSTFTPTDQVRLGSAMLAHRWFARRSSPLGVAGYAELGSAGILRYDPDIARLLGIGSEGGRFVFGAPSPDPVV